MATGGPVVVAGITLEYMSLDAALEALGMSIRDLEHLMAASTTWPFPGCLDGWKVSHDAIRYDMDGFLAAIASNKTQVDCGKSLKQWQVDAFQLICKDFQHAVHDHHYHEEEIFFPWMETRVKLPDKMSADHKTLMQLLSRVRDLCAELKPGADVKTQQPVLSELHSAFSQLRATMRQHLEEEEIVALPLLRKHFTAREAAVPEKKIVSKLKPSDMAWFLRPMPLQEKKATMTRLGIPGLVQRLVMLPAVAKDERTVLRAYRELAAGEQLPLPQKQGCLCFGRGGVGPS